MVGVQGIEPCASRSRIVRSTDELHPDGALGQIRTATRPVRTGVLYPIKLQGQKEN